MDTFEYRFVDASEITDYGGRTFLNDLGEKGWEWVDRFGDRVIFKRRHVDETLLQLLSFTVDQIESAISAENKEAKARDAMLFTLVQELVKKFCPDSPMTDLNKALEEDEKPVQPAQESALTSGENEQVREFADERIEQAMGHEVMEERVMSLLLYLSGSVMGYLPLQPEEAHGPVMLDAIYRYYERNPEAPVVSDMNCVLSTMLDWFASPEVLQMIEKQTGKIASMEGCMDDFFRLLMALQERQNAGSAPFTIDDVKEKAAKYVAELKDNGQDAWLERAEEYRKKLEQL